MQHTNKQGMWTVKLCSNSPTGVADAWDRVLGGICEFACVGPCVYA